MLNCTAEMLAFACYVAAQLSAVIVVSRMRHHAAETVSGNKSDQSRSMATPPPEAELAKALPSRTLRPAAQ
jgi:hypothetical protein